MLLEPIQGKIEHEAVFTEEQDSVQPVGVGPAPLVLQDQTGVAEQPLDTGRGGGRGEVAHRHPEQRRHQGVVAVQLLLAGVVPGGEVQNWGGTLLRWVFIPAGLRFFDGPFGFPLEIVAPQFSTWQTTLLGSASTSLQYLQ